MLNSKAFSVVSAVALSLITSAAQAQSAPPLTKVMIFEVKSTDQGVEPISEYQSATVRDHGGTQLRVVVREIGYGKSVHTVKLNGTLISNTVVNTIPLCGTAAAPTRTCNPGNIYIGYDKEFSLDGQSGGLFSVSTQNAFSPFNWITDTINIL